MPENIKTQPKIEVLLANLGTPTSPERKPVAPVLREFLSDRRVVDLPRFLWLPLLYGVIIPLRVGREPWGEELEYIPALNDTVAHARALWSLVSD